jgi:glycosyltransferase involved in cell wall biosynthesis
VESYGLVYVEAMEVSRTILTSDRDFARWLCGDAAQYFDPLDPVAAADAIERVLATGFTATSPKATSAILARDWDEVASGFAGVLRFAAGAKPRIHRDGTQRSLR